jgi:hypothetical protein
MVSTDRQAWGLVLMAMAYICRKHPLKCPEEGCAPNIKSERNQETPALTSTDDPTLA